MKRQIVQQAVSLGLTVILILALIPGVKAASIVDSGKCGDNLTWTLDSDGVLTISGTGEMWYDEGFNSWNWDEERIKEVVVGKDVTYIFNQAFSGASCPHLKAFRVESGNQIYSASDGVLFSDEGQVIVLYPGGNERTIYTVPQGVILIDAFSFFGCENVKEVVLTDSVLEIAYAAFLRCTSLIKISVPPSVQSIVQGAFSGCSGLRSINIPDGIKTIGDYTFNECYSLAVVTIPDSVTSIEYGAFGSCDSLTDVYYTGNESQWKRVKIDNGYNLNDPLLNATIHYNASAPEEQVEKEVNDSVFIRSITPESAEPGSSVTFTVTIDYTLQSEDQGEIDLGINVDDMHGKETDYRLFEWANVNKGSGSVTLSATVTTPTEWETKIAAFLTDGYGKTLASERVDLNSWKSDGRYKVENGADDTENDKKYLPTAARYVPYSEAIPAVQSGSRFALSSGTLPDGLILDSNGLISGIPTEVGVFDFQVTVTDSGGSIVLDCQLSVFTQYSIDVEVFNEPGYGFVETETDDGHVQDQVVTSAEELTDQVMHCEGAFSEFQNLYLDAQLLIRNVDYTAEEGSTKITVLAETIGDAGGGTHTLAAEFVTAEGKTVYTVQNYTVAGIASADVHVTVEGQAVLWTDAEPYIDTNNRTMTPLRAVGEALGLSAAWDDVNRELSFTNGVKTIYFPIDTPEARRSDGGTVTMDTSAVMVNGRTYAPIRYLAEFFGLSVSWDSKTRTVTIAKDEAEALDLNPGEQPSVQPLEAAPVTRETLENSRSLLMWIGASILLLVLAFLGAWIMRKKKNSK